MLTNNRKQISKNISRESSEMHEELRTTKVEQMAHGKTKHNTKKYKKTRLQSTLYNTLQSKSTSGQAHRSRKDRLGKGTATRKVIRECFWCLHESMIGWGSLHSSAT